MADIAGGSTEVLALVAGAIEVIAEIAAEVVTEVIQARGNPNKLKVVKQQWQLLTKLAYVFL